MVDQSWQNQEEVQPQETQPVSEEVSQPAQPVQPESQPETTTEPESGFPSSAPFGVGEAPPPPPPEMEEEVIRKPPLPLFIIIGALIIIGVIFFFFKILRKPKSGGEVNLTYWGLWEEESALAPIIESFQKDNPNIKITYQKHSPQDFRGRVMAAIEAGEGPDILRFHNTWLPMLKGYLAPVPEKVMDSSQFESTFYPVVSQDLKLQGKYYGLPLEIDGLALFYNEDILSAAGFSVPASWEDFQNQAFSLTVKDESGKIITSGAALGTASNIEHFSDILGLIMLQNSVDLQSPSSPEGIEALTFYRMFAEPPQNTWDETLDNSVLAFAAGEAAMIFAPSWEVFVIQAMNPDLNFKVAPVPQLHGVNISWASYWVEGVSSKSQHQAEAFEFLKYLISKETMVFLYTETAKIRLFGEPYSRKDLAPTLLDDPFLGSFISQAQNAQSFYMCSRTYDDGINDKIIKYYEDAVNSLSLGTSPQSALETVSRGVQQVLVNYGLVAAPPSE